MSIPSISFEGGPILVGSAGALVGWRGGEAPEYVSLCALFEADLSLKITRVPGHENDCIAADFGGPGTLCIIRNGRSLVLIRAWHEDPDSDLIYSEAVLADEPSTAAVGEIEFTGDTIAIAWAAESLAGISVSVQEPSVPRIDVAVDGSVLLHPLAKGQYRWCRAEITLPSGLVVRLVLDPR